MNLFFRLAFVSILLAAVTPALAVAPVATVLKSPDQGFGWAILAPGYTYTIANSFVAPVNGKIIGMGAFLRNTGPGKIRIKIFGSVNGNASEGPNALDVLAVSPVATGYYPSVTLVEFGPEIVTSGTLVAGKTYWVAASVVGLEDGPGMFDVGIHTQNSEGIEDNGTVWFSSAPDGLYFEGRHYTPEMALKVTILTCHKRPPKQCN